MSRRKPLLLAAAVALLAVPGAIAGPPAESCAENPDIGPNGLPFQSGMSPASDDFDLAGAGCEDTDGTADLIVCFVPENSCTMRLESRTPRGAVESGQLTINVVQGSCPALPANCVASDTGDSAAAVNLPVTAGTQYCAVFETGFPEQHQLRILDREGECGRMPVELQDFVVER